MRKVRFGRTDMEITPIGFGAWAVGGPWKYGWGAQDDSESIAAIRTAVENGINWIDTAAIYGLGHSEEVVNKALQGISERPYVFTKCSMIWDADGNVGNSLKAASIRREVEASLRRLGTDVIDLYQIHWPNPDAEIEEGWTTLAELKQEGKVRHIGVSNFNVEQMQRAMAITPVETLQPAYSLVRREVDEEILPFCEENDIGVIVYSPMMSGLLTGKMTRERIAALPADDWRHGCPEFNEPLLVPILELVEVLRGIGAAHGASAGEVAIAWTLMNPGVTAAIVGGRNAAQVEGVLKAADLELTADELVRIGDLINEKLK